MTSTGWIIAGVILLVAAAACLEVYMKRNRRRPLAKTRPASFQRRELGLEATDAAMADRAHRENQRKEDDNSRRILRKLK